MGITNWNALIEGTFFGEVVECNQHNIDFFMDYDGLSKGRFHFPISFSDMCEAWEMNHVGEDYFSRSINAYSVPFLKGLLTAACEAERCKFIEKFFRHIRKDHVDGSYLYITKKCNKVAYNRLLASIKKGLNTRED